MEKIFWIDQDKCRGCRTCEMACSFFKHKACNPSRSSIRSDRWEDPSFLGKTLTRVCQQCTPPSCEAICPVKAISIDEKTGAMLIDYNICIGQEGRCGLCIHECPFGSIQRDPETGMPFVCDLCGGAPKCGEWCPANAIQYMPTTWSNLMKKRELSAALLSLVKEATKFNMTKYNMKE